MIISIITGLSGSGKTTAVHALEDMGFFCIDNLPATLAPSFLELVATRNEEQGKTLDKIGVVIDARGQLFFKGVEEWIRKIRKKHRLRVLYFHSRDEVLFQRYQASRRKHPLETAGTLMEGVQKEKKILAPLKKLADKVIDTSDVNVHELKQMVFSFFHFVLPEQSMKISLISFGYKHGLPQHADLVFDVRFLANPYFIKKMKDKTGKSIAVRNFVLKQKQCQVFLKKIQSLLIFLVREYKKEGKSYLTIAFGCTGGKHRSIAVAEAVGRFLKENNIRVQLQHRDIKA